MPESNAMKFKRVVAIDWSGARRPGRKIQVAEYDPVRNCVTLVQPPKRGNRNRNWNRNDVWNEYFNKCSDEGPVLIGIDFAFAYPYCDQGAYFPGHSQTPPDVKSLWAKVDRICSHESDFYGGPFYLKETAPFADHFLYQTYRGRRYQERFRQTDLACKSAGLNPASVFKCVGPGHVGVGSIAGFRLLHKIKSKNAAHIWPFHRKPASSGTTVVEIYPARFLECAGVNHKETQMNMSRALKNYDARLSSQLKNRNFTDDERDALVSAAGMKWWLSQKGLSVWSVADTSCAMYEGWIFGI